MDKKRKSITRTTTKHKAEAPKMVSGESFWEQPSINTWECTPEEFDERWNLCNLIELARMLPGPHTPDPLDTVRRFLVAQYGFDPRTLRSLSMQYMVASVEAAQQKVAMASRNDTLPKERLLFDLDTKTITLDGKVYRNLAPEAYQILEAIWKEHPQSVSSSRLNSLKGLKGKNFTRELDKLPVRLRAIIQGNPGSGRWIQLLPLPGNGR